MTQATAQNILTINFGGIGDEILFLPALKQIRQALPEAKITLLVEPRSRSVEEVTDLIDAVITFDIKKRPLLPTDLWQLLSLIRAGSYDLVLSSGSSPQVAALLFLSGIQTRIGYGSNALATMLLTHPVPLKRDQYAGNMYHDLVVGLYKYLDRTMASRGQVLVPEVTVKKESRAAMAALLKNESTNSGGVKEKLVLLHPGTSTMAVQKGIIKTWPSEHWLNLIERLSAENIRVILAGGPDDKEVIAALEARLDASPGGRPTNLQSFAGKTRSLADLAALIDLCDVMVCVDSAPMHLAVGLNKKIVALFGPTEPEKLIPNRANFKVLADRPASPPRSLLDGLGVRLQPDIVYQSVLDLLKAE